MLHLPALFSLPWHLSLFALTLTGVQASIGTVDVNDILGTNNQPILSYTDSGKSPWALKPHCIKGLQPKKQKEGKVFCVQTYRRHTGQDISLITTPETAYQTVNALDEDPVSVFLDYEAAEEYREESLPWKIVSIEGKDMGVKATRKIGQYETFMFDQASIVVALDLDNEAVIKRADYGELLETATSQLGNPDTIRKLCKGSPDGSPPVRSSHLEDIMENNAFGSSIGDIEVKGLFPSIARINHDCVPNAFIMFSPSGLSVGLKAYRDIAAGEEITVSYLPLGMTHSARQAALKGWGFECSCSLCADSASSIAAHDAKRERIKALESEIQATFQEGFVQGAIRLGQELLELTREEGLTPMLADEYVMLAKLHLAAQDEGPAEEYGELAIEVLKDLGFLGDVDEGGKEWDLESLLRAFGGQRLI
ncbi:SET domain-containing protein [Polyplosphaeria fusca]|uniref:SET domain-containing protein n=1 Tax=Polyplosphaeria fusca TaxID=682080 RepID=A0A9P4QM88_9PLEO|nr:SET domain-containing protein [Polyplosphaeria fusca]